MPEEFVDQEFVCKDCKQPFIFKAGEHRFFVEKQFSLPVRCKPCRDRRKAEKDGGIGGGAAAFAPSLAPAPRPYVAEAPPLPKRTGNGGGGGRDRSRRRRDDGAWD
jgi:hypothetical protein